MLQGDQSAPGGVALDGIEVHEELVRARRYYTSAKVDEQKSAFEWDPRWEKPGIQTR